MVATDGSTMTGVWSVWKSPRAVLAGSVCLIVAVGFAVQTAALVRTMLGGLDHPAQVRRDFLHHAHLIVPDTATFASNAFGSGYLLYPSRRVKANLSTSSENLHAIINRQGVRYLVVAYPLPDSLAGFGRWTRQVYRDRHGVVLEVR